MAGLRPVRPVERTQELDVLRGFALLGVLLGNLFHLYSGRGLTANAATPAPHALDGAATFFVDQLVSGKAQTLLTLLFGLGFAMQLVRAGEQGRQVTGLFVSRLLALLAIGWAHVVLLWWGDVTWTYALTGFFLLPFRRCRPRTLLLIGLVLVIVPKVVLGIPESGQAASQVLITWPERHELMKQLAAAAVGTDYVALMRANAQWALAFSAPISWYPLWLVGQYLLGFHAGKRHLVDQAADHLGLYRRLLVGGTAIAAFEIVLGLVLRTYVAPSYVLTLPGHLALGVLGAVAPAAKRWSVTSGVELGLAF